MKPLKKQHFTQTIHIFIYLELVTPGGSVLLFIEILFMASVATPALGLALPRRRSCKRASDHGLSIDTTTFFDSKSSARGSARCRPEGCSNETPDLFQSLRFSESTRFGKEGERSSEEIEFIRRVRAGDTEWITLQLEAMPPEEAHDMVNLTSNDLSVLILAIRYQYPNVVQLLLNYGADPTYDCQISLRETTGSRRSRATRRENVGGSLGGGLVPATAHQRASVGRAMLDSHDESPYADRTHPACHARCRLACPVGSYSGRHPTPPPTPGRPLRTSGLPSWAPILPTRSSLVGSALLHRSRATAGRRLSPSRSRPSGRISYGWSARPTY